jgi:hypothetical protein
MKNEALDNLLARGRLGGRVRESILEQALRSADVIPPPWYRSRFVLWGSPALATVALAAMALVLRPATRDTIRSKGDPGRAIVVSAECGGPNPTSCTLSDTLLFRVEGVEEQLCLAAYAEPEAGGERIWFFPLADGTEPFVLGQKEPQVLRQGVNVRSLPVGRYDIRVVLGARPLSKDEVISGAGHDVVAVRTVQLQVTP